MQYFWELCGCNVIGFDALFGMLLVVNHVIELSCRVLVLRVDVPVDKREGMFQPKLDRSIWN